MIYVEYYSDRVISEYNNDLGAFLAGGIKYARQDKQ